MTYSESLDVIERYSDYADAIVTRAAKIILVAENIDPVVVQKARSALADVRYRLWVLDKAPLMMTIPN
jgi:hypothetical protein